MMNEFLIVTYVTALIVILAFSLGQLHLSYYYTSKKRRKTDLLTLEQVEEPVDLPIVTVQLPIFNEFYVAERLIECIASLDYPKDRLEIQVLDDSTDETRALVASKVNEIGTTGIDIVQIHRVDRSGYKAGALHEGLKVAKGEFVAIFDADFLPEKDFLKKTIPHFTEKIGLVQARWGHINDDFSLLTKLQAFGLNAHFTVEQKGRNLAKSFINFNGTAGVWRKTCIDSAGGWSADTLSEDLDLSYRAQLKGWEFKYLEDVVAPAELPVMMDAIKSQQYRWNKGAAETAKKNLGKVLISNLGFRTKLHASLHLLNSSVFMCVFLSSIVSVPLLYVKATAPEFNLFFDLASVFLIGFLAMVVHYWIAAKKTIEIKTFKRFILYFPLFLSFSLGLSLHNAIAVFEGWLGVKTPFIRTPKFNIVGKDKVKGKNMYVKPKVSVTTFIEGIMGCYFLFGLGLGIYLWDLGLIFFHFMLTVGFFGIFIYSIKPVKYAIS